MQNRLHCLFKCYGGKFYLANHITSFFPSNYEDLTYVEVAGGAANVLLTKKPSKVEIYNDIDKKIWNIFYCLCADTKFFIDLVNKTEYNLETFNHAKEQEQNWGNWLCSESAINELILRRMSRTGMKKHFSWSERLRGGIPGDVNAFNNFKKALPLIAERLEKVKFYCMDMFDAIKFFDSPEALFYIDPPYLKSTRTSKEVYEYEMTDDEHRRLGEILNTVKGKVVLSGYDSLLYQDLFKNWRTVRKVVANNAGQTKIKSLREEVLWLNY